MATKNIDISAFIKKKSALSIGIVDSTNYSITSIKKILDPFRENGFDNVSFFDFSKNKNFEDFMDICNTYPYLSEYRYIVVSGIKESDKETINKISDYLLDPMQTTKHIFIFENDKININCDYIIEEDQSKPSMFNFIKKEMKSRGISLTSNEIERLSEKSKSKLSIISYLEKLKSINVANSLNSKLINELLNDQINESFKETYDLINYINKKNLRACLQEVEKTKFKENIFLEISKLSWRFRTYLKIKSMKNASYSKEEIINTTKISKYQFKYMDQEIANKSTEEILDSLRTLKRIDTLLKTSNIDHENIMLLLFKKLCRN